MTRSEAEAEFMGGFRAAATSDAKEFKRLDARIAKLESALRRIEQKANVPDQTDEDDVLARLQDVEILVAAALYCHGDQDDA